MTAGTVERAVVDPGLRGQILEVGSPQNLSFNELAALLQELRGQPTRIRHIPRWLLRAVAPLHRQPRATFATDTADTTFRPPPNGNSLRAATDIREALTRAATDGG